MNPPIVPGVFHDPLGKAFANEADTPTPRLRQLRAYPIDLQGNNAIPDEPLFGQRDPLLDLPPNVLVWHLRRGQREHNDLKRSFKRSIALNALLSIALILLGLLA